MGMQVGYAAITSRLLPPSAFGAYAVALSGVGFIGMLGGSSLGQAAARRDHDSVHLDRSLVTLALIVGSSTALLAILLAPFWGRLWGVPAAQVTQVLALGIPPCGAVRCASRDPSPRWPDFSRRRTDRAWPASRDGPRDGSVLSIGTVWSLGVASVAGLSDGASGGRPAP